MVRVQDIAKAAGVGVGTVSRMIKGNGYVSEEKKEKIQKAMEALGYVWKKPEEVPGDRMQKLIGVTVPMISHPFFGMMVSCVENELAVKGYRCLLINEQGILEKGQDAIRLLDEKKIDGLISFGNMPYGFEGRNGRPIVTFDRNWLPDVPIVRSDHAMGGRMAAEKFLKDGKKKIVQFVGGSDMKRSANLRCRELMRQMEENGGEVINILTDWDAISYEYNKEIVVRYINTIRSADGCLATDIGAICCQNVLQSLGVKIPEDFEIIAYDGTVLTNLVEPKQPVIQQDMTALAKKLVEVLCQMIDGEELEQLLFEIPVIWKE